MGSEMGNYSGQIPLINGVSDMLLALYPFCDRNGTSILLISGNLPHDLHIFCYIHKLSYNSQCLILDLKLPVSSTLNLLQQ